MEKIKQHIIDTFKDVSFDEPTHVYHYKNIRIKKSVSTLLDRFIEPFDEQKKSYYSAIKAGITQEEMLFQWHETSRIACEDGTKVHLFGEKYAFDRSLKPDGKKEEAVVKFWNDLPDYIVPCLMEQTMVHLKYMYSGTADILLYDKRDGKFWIFDYKTNKNLFKNYKGQKMLGIFKDLLDNPHNHYILQLSYYQLLLEQTGIEIKGRSLVYLKPDGNYELYPMKNVTKILKKDLDENGI